MSVDNLNDVELIRGSKSSVKGSAIIYCIKGSNEADPFCIAKKYEMRYNPCAILTEHALTILNNGPSIEFLDIMRERKLAEIHSIEDMVMCGKSKKFDDIAHLLSSGLEFYGHLLVQKIVRQIIHQDSVSFYSIPNRELFDVLSYNLILPIENSLKIGKENLAVEIYCDSLRLLKDIPDESDFIDIYDSLLRKEKIRALILARKIQAVQGRDYERVNLICDILSKRSEISRDVFSKINR